MIELRWRTRTVHVVERETILEYRQCGSDSRDLPDGVSYAWSEWAEVPNIFQEDAEFPQSE